MVKCITKEKFQTYDKESDFMILFGENNYVYHFNDPEWVHPGGWKDRLDKYAGQLKDAQPEFKMLQHSVTAKGILEKNFYGYLSQGDCSEPVPEQFREE